MIKSAKMFLSAMGVNHLSLGGTSNIHYAPPVKARQDGWDKLLSADREGRIFTHSSRRQSDTKERQDVLSMTRQQGAL